MPAPVRENTERPITVVEGTNTIVGLDPIRIRGEVTRILSNMGKRGRIPKLWDGHSAKRIVKILYEQLAASPNQHQAMRPPLYPSYLARGINWVDQAE